MTNGPEDKLPISFPSARLENWKDWARALKALGVRESDDVIRRATSLNEAPNVGKAKESLNRAILITKSDDAARFSMAWLLNRA